MADENQESGLNFDLPKHRSSVIKVIGVGGGGSNAVNHMKEMGIKGVDFMICNTDAQALEHSLVENRIQLGANLTEGLGAGANPDVGRDAAQESLEEIREVLKNNTRMVFITAGMGGGTGTGGDGDAGFGEPLEHPALLRSGQAGQGRRIPDPGLGCAGGAGLRRDDESGVTLDQKHFTGQRQILLRRALGRGAESGAVKRLGADEQKQIESVHCRTILWFESHGFAFR